GIAGAERGSLFLRKGGQGGEHRKTGSAGQLECLFHHYPLHSAVSSVSPVRMRTAWPTSRTKILPSPIAPVLAAAWIVSTTRSAMSAPQAISILILGTMLVLYSAPR